VHDLCGCWSLGAEVIKNGVLVPGRLETAEHHTLTPISIFRGNRYIQEFVLFKMAFLLTKSGTIQAARLLMLTETVPRRMPLIPRNLLKLATLLHQHQTMVSRLSQCHQAVWHRAMATYHVHDFVWEAARACSAVRYGLGKVQFLDGALFGQDLEQLWWHVAGTRIWTFAEDGFGPPVQLLRGDVGGRYETLVRIHKPEGNETAVAGLGSILEAKARNAMLAFDGADVST